MHGDGLNFKNILIFLSQLANTIQTVTVVVYNLGYAWVDIGICICFVSTRYRLL